MASENTICVAPDLGCWVLFPDTSDKTVYLVGSPQADKYLTVPAKLHPLVMQVLDKLRLGHLPEQIESELRDQGLLVNVREFCQLLARKKLIEWTTGEEQAGDSARNVTPVRWAAVFGHLRALSWQVFSLNLEPYRSTLDRLSPVALRLLVMGAAATSLVVAMLGGLNVTALRQMVSQVLDSQSLFWLTLANMLLMPVFILLHELAHAVIAAQGRVYPRQLSLRLYLFSVAYFSLQLPGLYTLPIRNRFLAISAGPLMDLTLGNLFFLAARNAGPVLAPWLAFMALSNYGRLIFNLLPILPMTDGYALLSQAVFREIDIRGRAAQEYRRWRQKKPNNFRGKYVIFFAFNIGVAAFIIVGALLQVNAMTLEWLTVSGLLPAGRTSWWAVAILLMLDGLCLYLARHRLRVLLGG